MRFHERSGADIGDGRLLAADAGYGRLSAGSVLAGVLVAIGGVALLTGVVAMIADAGGYERDLRDHWNSWGMATGLGVALLAFVCFLYGGYVAGRMARRSGLAHGLTVFGGGVVVLAGAAVLAWADLGDRIIGRAAGGLGVPVGTGAWHGVAVVCGATTAAVMLIGCLLGGLAGERWHTTLVRRAAEPPGAAEEEPTRPEVVEGPGYERLSRWDEVVTQRADTFGARLGREVNPRP